MTEPRYTVMNGQRVLVVNDVRGLPQKLDALLAAMSHFGFAFRDDFTPGGARTACTATNTHRMRVFREGRWWNPAPFRVHGDHPLTFRVVDAGQLLLRLEMCQDCAAVCVRDVSPELALGARAMRLTNRVTGAERIAPAVGRRNIVLGWYSGKRRAGREYK